MNEPREKDDRREPLEGRVMTDETGKRMRGVRGSLVERGIKVQIDEAREMG